MAIARVGAVGTVASGTSSCAPSFPQATSAGNLLVAWGTGDSLAIVNGTGWTRIQFGFSAMWYKPNCSAGETAPSFTSSSFVSAVFCEFSGVATSSPTDQPGTTSGLTSPLTATFSAADVAAGELIIGVSTIQYSMAATKTTSHAYNNGATAVNVGNNDATSTVNHYRFSYGITTGNSSADTLTVTFTTTNITDHGSLGESFQVAAAATKAPPVSRIPRRRSMNRTRV